MHRFISLPVLPSFAIFTLVILCGFFVRQRRKGPKIISRSKDASLPPSPYHLSPNVRTQDITLPLPALQEVSKDPDIPDGWYSHPRIFALERRAIFSTSWLCVTHSCRFSNAGDYLAFNVAGFPFFLIVGKDSVLRGFHDVCRHRAYTVTKKPAGSSLVLGCRYHGWSYDTKGHLTKAPHFDSLPNFKKEDNSLFQIWVKSDPRGFIFINFDASWDVEEPPLEASKGFAVQHSVSLDAVFIASWKVEGIFNWKFAASKATDQGSKDGISTNHSISFLSRLRNGQTSVENQALLFPLTTLRRIRGSSLWTMTIIEPTSASQTSIRCDVYTSNPKERLANDLTTLENEFKLSVQELTESFPALSSSNVSANLENSMSGFNRQISKELEKHMKLERKSGAEIFPAAAHEMVSKDNSGSCGVAERLCKELDSLAEAGMGCLKSTDSLAW